MEGIRLGEAVIRSSQPLLPFLAPNFYRVPHTRRSAAAAVTFFAQGSHSHPAQCQASRPFSISHRRAQDGVAGSSEAPRRFPSQSPSSGQSVNDSIASILNSAMENTKGTPTAPTSRTSRSSSPRTLPRNASFRGPSGGEPSRSASSVDDLLNSIGFGGRNESSRPNVGNALDPYNRLGPPPAPAAEQFRIKLGPTVGRTVPVEAHRGRDVGHAFRQLEILCSRNSIRRDANRQRYHERPGMRRKRLKSERWRRNFKAGFQAMVAKVQQMRRQGW